MACFLFNRQGAYTIFTTIPLSIGTANGHLQLLARHPADLAAYFAWMDIIKEIYGSVQNFVIQERLKWPQTQFEPGHSPGELLTMDINDALKLDEHMVPKREGEGWFKARSGKLHCKILENDWPYSVQSGKHRSFPLFLASLKMRRLY